MRERDLFGQWASRWRVIRTSNGFGSDKFPSGRFVESEGRCPSHGKQSYCGLLIGKANPIAVDIISLSFEMTACH